jgi:hypothetical protein
MVSLPVYAEGRAAPVETLTVRFKTTVLAPGENPFGALQPFPEPLTLDNGPVTFQGWALDALNLERVRVAHVAGFREVTIGTTRGVWRRPDLPALFPNAHDLLNSGWIFVLEPRALAGVPRPAILRFYAESGDGRRALIGTATIQ